MAFFKSLRKGRKSGSTHDDSGSKSESNEQLSTNASAAATPATAPPPATKRQPSSYSNKSSTPAAERPGSLKASKSKFFSSGSTSRRKMSSSAEGPRPVARTPSATAGSSQPPPLPTTPAVDDGAPLAKQTSAGSAGPPPGPRPSDLFAGKGLAWGDLDLTSGGSVTKPPQTQDDLQNFLKARRQWVPTFVTDVKEDVDVKQVSKPDDISFSSTLPEAGTLLSIKDLDESHKRKERLLGNFEASEADRWADQTTATATNIAAPSASSPYLTSNKSASTPPTAIGRAAAITTATSNAGSMDSGATAGITKSNSTRKPAPPRASMTNGRNGVAAVLPSSSSSSTIAKQAAAAPSAEAAAPAPAAPAAAAAAPPVAAVLPPSAPAAVNPTPAATATPPSASATTQHPTPTGGVRESIDTAGGFATPNEESSRQQSEVGHGGSGGALGMTPQQLQQQDGEQTATEAQPAGQGLKTSGEEAKEVLQSVEATPKSSVLPVGEEENAAAVASSPAPVASS